MGLFETLKAARLQAMKDREVVKRDLLGVVIGQLQQGNDTSDDAVIKNCRKMVKGNEEVMAQLEGTDRTAELAAIKQENEILIGLMPRELSAEEIRALISTSNVDVVGAANDGAAMGMAMKMLKEVSGAPFDGRTVKAVVSELRSNKEA